MIEIRTRAVFAPIEASLRDAGVHPVLARLYAARGVRTAQDLDTTFGALLPPSSLRNADAAAALLADCIERAERLVIVADYDCDGATACAVGLRALRSFGARVDYFVPDRFELGYGLTPEVVERVAPLAPHVLITVDNGIASIAGVAAANARGLRTLVTDHHLPAEQLPAAACIVNPNQPGCAFPSKAMAGVGVMYYVMLALRAELRRRGHFRTQPEPNLAALLDLVALGTVADVVPLDRNNRVLVDQGLRRIRAGRHCPGIGALLTVAGRDARLAGTFDLAFALGPRVNAAGRLADMSLGIECLATDDAVRALAIAQDLDRLNRERREIEGSMQRDADALVGAIDPAGRASLALFDPSWHQGVIGILAGRIKDRFHRPTFCFAPAGDAELRGSGRSIAGLHLRDCLDLVSKVAPDLLLRFGGHAAAAGLTIRASNFERFAETLEAVTRRLVDEDVLAQVIETDGSLEGEYVSWEVARMLEAGIWGQGFPPPLFADLFEVEGQRLVGERHLRLKLRHPGRRVDAILFNRSEALPGRIRGVYRLGIDEYNNFASVQVRLEHWTPA